MTSTPITAELKPVSASGGETNLLHLMIAVAKHKKLILTLPFVVAIVVALISLLVPDTFRAGTRILPPEKTQNGAAALLSQLGGAASAAAGAAGIKNPNDLYIGMLRSRTVSDAMVRQFNLLQVYDTDSAERARKYLDDDTLISSGKDGLILVEVESHNRKLAADMANAYIVELRKLTSRLAITEAAHRRVFFEGQLQAAKNNLTAAEIALKDAIGTSGVISVDSESRSVVEMVGKVRAQISAKEIELNSMKAFVTPNNTAHVRLQEELKSLRAELSKLENGRGDAAVGSGKSSSGLRNIGALRDVKYYEMLNELLAKQYELARLDEAKDAPLIQVLDVAVAPERKAKPRRAIIVLLAAFFGFLFAVSWAILRATRERAMQVPELAAQWTELQQHLQFRRKRA